MVYPPCQQAFSSDGFRYGKAVNKISVIRASGMPAISSAFALMDVAYIDLWDLERASKYDQNQVES